MGRAVQDRPQPGAGSLISRPVNYLLASTMSTTGDRIMAGHVDADDGSPRQHNHSSEPATEYTGNASPVGSPVPAMDRADTECRVSAATDPRSDVTVLPETSDDPEATGLYERDRPEPHTDPQASIVLAAKGHSDDTHLRYFGDYELLHEVARGGMGVVYRARQVSLDRVVAIKMILAGNFASPRDVRRFQVEAQAAANLTHPAIVPIFEIGEHQGHHFFSMGFVEGQSVQERIRNGPLPAREAAVIVRRVARAIEYAHQQGVIHRDLKPANILLDKNGQPQVTDFGLAKMVGGKDELTATGQAMGTPSYMPPEQVAAKSRKLGPPADIYSLGATLYAIVAGRPPFQASTAIDTMIQVLEQEPVSPRALNPQVERDLETICLKCLNKDPRRRYSSAGEVADELGRYLEGQPIKARPVSLIERGGRWCGRNPVLATLGACLVGSLFFGTVIAAGLAFFAYTSYRQSREEVYAARIALAQNAWDSSNTGRASQLLDSLVPGILQPQPDLRGWDWEFLHRRAHDGLRLLASDSGYVVDRVIFRPDGRALASAGYDGIIRVWATADGSLLRRIKGHSAQILGLAFSPDGRLIASGSRDRTVRLWEADTGREVRTLARLPDSVQNAAFSPDGLWVAATAADGSIKVWTASDGKPLWEVSGPTGHSSWTFGLAFSPDGGMLATAGGDTQIKIWAARDGRPVRTLAGHTDQVHSIAFSPDSRRLVSGSFDQSLKIWDVGSGRELQRMTGHSNWVQGVAFSPDGQRIASGASDQTIRIWDADTGREVGMILGHTGSVQSVAFSPDGRLIASSGEDASARVWDSTGNAAVVALSSTDEARSLGMVFSPDGKWLATTHDDGIIRIRVTGSGLISRLIDARGAPAATLVFDRAGQNLAGVGQDGTVRVWNLRSGRLVKFVRAATSGSRRIAVSPEIDRIAILNDEGLVTVRDLAGHRPDVLLRGDPPGSADPVENTASVLAFSPDGHRLAAAHNNGKLDLWNIESERRLVSTKLSVWADSALAWRRGWPAARRGVHGSFCARR